MNWIIWKKYNRISQGQFLSTFWCAWKWTEGDIICICFLAKTFNKRIFLVLIAAKPNPYHIIQSWALVWHPCIILWIHNTLFQLLYNLLTKLWKSDYSRNSLYYISSAKLIILKNWEWFFWLSDYTKHLLLTLFLICTNSCSDSFRFTSFTTTFNQTKTSFDP